MKFVLDNRFFSKLQKNNKKAVKLWKELSNGKHRAYLSSILLTEFFSTIHHKLTKKQRKTLEKILEFSSVKKKNKGDMISFSVNKAMPTLLLVESTPKLSIEAGKIKRNYNIPMGDSFVAATYKLTPNCNFILSDDDEHFDKISWVKRKDLEEIF